MLHRKEKVKKIHLPILTNFVEKHPLTMTSVYVTSIERPFVSLEPQPALSPIDVRLPWKDYNGPRMAAVNKIVKHKVGLGILPSESRRQKKSLTATE